MALLIKGNNITDVWRKLIGDLFVAGQRSAPRGFETREILNVTIEVLNGLNNIIVSKERDLNYRFMIAEWLWIMGGLNDVESLAQYNSIMRKFSDDGSILNGAYGPRLSIQWDYVIKSLKKSHETRQAVASIWTPSPESSKDIPCTVSLQWLIREKKLHCIINMRSSDVWLGLPYDYFSFSQLTNMVSSKIEIPVGSITMNLGSSHLYASNNLGALKVLVEEDYDYITSPQLKPGLLFPTQTEIKTILNKENTSMMEPWDSYSRALMTNKKQAFLTLKNLQDGELCLRG